MLRMTKISTMIWQASVLLKKNDQETYVTLAIDKNHTLPIIKDGGDIYNENRTETPKKQANTIKGVLLWSVSFTPIHENQLEKGNAYRIHVNFKIFKIKDYKCLWNADSHWSN